VICSVCAESFFGNKNDSDIDPSTAEEAEEVLKLDDNILGVFSLKVVAGLSTVTSDVDCIRHPERSVSLEHLIPDLLLFDIPSIYRVQESIKIGRSLGEGMFERDTDQAL
jgi:hypothetical protein